MIDTNDLYAWLNARLDGGVSDRKFAKFEVLFLSSDGKEYAVPADTQEDADWILNLLKKAAALKSTDKMAWSRGVQTLVSHYSHLNPLMDYNKMYCYNLTQGIERVIGIR